MWRVYVSSFLDENLWERRGWFVHHITQGVRHHYCSEEDERCPFDKPCCICNWEGWEKKGKNPKEKIKSTKETVLCLVCMQENDSDMKGEAWVYLKCIPKSIVFMKKQCNSFCPISPLVVIRLNLLKNNWWICIFLTLIIIIKTCFWLDLEALVCLFVYYRTCFVVFKCAWGSRKVPMIH